MFKDQCLPLYRLCKIIQPYFKTLLLRYNISRGHQRTLFTLLCGKMALYEKLRLETNCLFWIHGICTIFTAIIAITSLVLVIIMYVNEAQCCQEDENGKPMDMVPMNPGQDTIDGDIVQGLLETTSSCLGRTCKVTKRSQTQVLINLREVLRVQGQIFFLGSKRGGQNFFFCDFFFS